MHLLDLVEDAVTVVALLVESAAVLLVAIGAAQALLGLLRQGLRRTPPALADRRVVWLRFATWLLLALEFALAADIARTAVTPTWQSLGQLAVIAVIRTGLGYFLARDMREMLPAAAAAAAAATPAPAPRSA